MKDMRELIDLLNEAPPKFGSLGDVADGNAQTDDNTEEVPPRPTGKEEGDPYNIVNLQQMVDSGQTGLQGDLDRAKKDLESDQAEWDKEYGKTHNPDGSEKTDDDKPEFGAGEQGGRRPRDDQSDDQDDVDNTPPETPQIIQDPEVPTGPGGDSNTIIGAPTDDSGDEQPPEAEFGAGQDSPPADDTQPTPGPDDGTRGGQEPNRSPQGDALAGRLDTTTPSLMDAYNDGGRQAMDSVRDLQQGLQRLGIDPNGVDGKYGRGTFAAVQEFQRQQGLQVDGEAGPETMAALQRELNTQAGAEEEQPADDTQPTPGPDDGTRGGQEPNREPEARGPDDGNRGGQEPNRGGTVGPVRPEEMDRFQELLDKGAGSAAGSPDSREAGVPDAERDSRERGVMTASYDLGFRQMFKLVESLSEALSDLTQEEQAELTALYNKMKGSNDPRARQLVQQYERMQSQAQSTNTNTNTTTQTTTQTTDDGNVLEKHNALASEFRTGQHPSVAKIEQDLLSGMEIVKFNGNWMTALRQEAQKADPQRFQSLNKKLQSALIGYFNKKYNGGDDKNFRVGNTNQFFQQIQQKHGQSQQAAQGQQQAGQTNNTASGNPERIDFSWDNNMTNKTKLQEASMNISMNGSSASEIGELMRIMQLAGAPNAAPVADMHVDMPMAHDALHTDIDSHNEEPCPVCGMKHGEESPSPCGMGEEIVGEEWDNAPNEEYKDHNHMTKDLSGGINRMKKAYAAAQDGDNAMAVESIKDRLFQALEGKYANDAQRKAVHAAKDKKRK